MKPVKLKIKGFRSFKSSQTIPFDLAAGLYQLTGVNKVFPELGRNATGKTSVWDALKWVLFGTTHRGLKGPVVVNWKSKTALGVFHFNHHDSDYVLKRTQTPNAILLSKDGQDYEKTTQDAINSLLGFGPESFSRAVLLGQFNTFFLDLSPTEMMRVFLDSLDLSRWDAARKEAQRKKDLTDSALLAVDATLSGVSGRLEELRKHSLKAMKREVKELEAHYASLEKKDESVRLKIAELELLNNDMVSSIAAIKTELEEHIKGEPARWSKLKTLEKAATELSSCRTQVNERIAEWKAQLSDIQSMKATACPTCLTVLSSKAVRSAEILIEGKVSELKKERVEIKRLQAESADELEIVRKANEKMAAKAAAISDKLKAAEADDKERRAKISSLEESRNDLIAETSRVGINLVDLKSAYQKRKEREAELESEHTEAQDRSAKLKARLSRFAYWVDGFKQIKLEVIDSALAELNVLCKSNLQKMGLPEWDISMQIEKEKKSGDGVIRGFHVMITSPDSKEAVPWEVWSGGETQRLRVAGEAAVATLLRERMGIDFPVEIWDEPTAGLSPPVGIEQILEFLSARANLEQRPIWVVDHHSLNSGLFAGRYAVTKDENGSAFACIDK